MVRSTAFSLGTELWKSNLGTSVKGCNANNVECSIWCTTCKRKEAVEEEEGMFGQFLIVVKNTTVKNRFRFNKT